VPSAFTGLSHAMRFLDAILLLAALLGHCALWISILNRVHGLGIYRRLVDLTTVVTLALLPLAPAAVVAEWLWPGLCPPLTALVANSRLRSGYLAVCWIAAAVVTVDWLRRKLWATPPALLTSNHTRRVNIAERLGHVPLHGFVAHALRRVPGNECLSVQLQEKTLALARLDPALDGLRILHLSDFHFTGRVGKPFYAEVVRQALAMRPDLIALTGDFVDTAAGIDWIPEVLGPLTARHGTFFVLGNHDPWVGQTARLRSTLTGCGFADLGSRWVAREIRGRPVLLAGSEMPWIPPAPDLPKAKGTVPVCSADSAKGDSPRPLRLLLAHTPDVWRWAARHDFDLMLAGHTHGGQICLPLIGPIFCPSRYGVSLAAGVFQRPPTVLHVSRGLGGEVPLRWNCPPEAALLILRSAAPANPT